MGCGKIRKAEIAIYGTRNNKSGISGMVKYRTAYPEQVKR